MTASERSRHHEPGRSRRSVRRSTSTPRRRRSGAQNTTAPWVRNASTVRTAAARKSSASWRVRRPADRRGVPSRPRPSPPPSASARCRRCAGTRPGVAAQNSTVTAGRDRAEPQGPDQAVDGRHPQQLGQDADRGAQLHVAPARTGRPRTRRRRAARGGGPAAAGRTGEGGGRCRSSRRGMRWCSRPSTAGPRRGAGCCCPTAVSRTGVTSAANGLSAPPHRKVKPTMTAPTPAVSARTGAQCRQVRQPRPRATTTTPADDHDRRAIRASRWSDRASTAIHTTCATRPRPSRA